MKITIPNDDLQTMERLEKNIWLLIRRGKSAERIANEIHASMVQAYVAGVGRAVSGAFALPDTNHKETK